MIYEAPALTNADLAVLERIDQLRTDLQFYLLRPRRWFGTLRRATVALAVQGSNTIEGYHASVEDVAAVLQDEEPLDADTETRHAIAGYRDAMTYVLQLAANPPPLDVSRVQALHFMMMKYDLTRNPGQWRPGGVWIENEQGVQVYEAPERDLVDELMAETLDRTNNDEGPVLVRAAMAHLNLTLIHPFSDGNGRMARCLQTYVLASAGLISPEFASIEEYLGKNTADYYGILTQVAQGRWSPEHDASPWVRFCLTAHYRQARTVLRRVHEAEALWDRCEQLARDHRTPSRAVAVLCDSARGWRMWRSRYIKTVNAATGEDLTAATATRDLQSLVEKGLLRAVGERRARRYEPTAELANVWNDIRSQRLRAAAEDPYES